MDWHWRRKTQHNQWNKCQQETHYHKHSKSTWNNSQHVKIVYVAYALIAPVLDNFPHNPVVTLQHCIKNVYIVPGEKCYDVGSKASWTSSTPSSGCWKICRILSVGPYLEKIKEHGKETVPSDRAEFQSVQKDVTMQHQKHLRGYLWKMLQCIKKTCRLLGQDVKTLHRQHRESYLKEIFQSSM